MRTILLETRKDSSGNLLDCIALSKMSDGIWRQSANSAWDIFYQGGNVGIGTGSTVPSYPAIRIVNTDPIPGGIDTSNFSALQTIAEKGAVQGRIGAGYNGAESAVFMMSATDTPLTFLANGAEKMRIQSNGNVRVGTNSPTDRLHVAGDLKVEGCVKDGGGSYVAGTCLSDERLKKDIRPVGRLLDR
jgi:hypothetical protein